MSGLFQAKNVPSMLSGGALAGGEIGNILEQQKRSQYQNYIMGILKDPAKLAQMASKVQQPLNNGLTQSVNNQVQGDMASRGLSQAPGIFAASESQALAPYIQHNQDTAMAAVLQSLGMPQGTFSPPQNLSGGMSTFLNTLQKKPQQIQPIQDNSQFADIGPMVPPTQDPTAGV